MNYKIKVLHLIPCLDTGGTEMMLFKLLNGMDKQRFENRVVSLIPVGSVGEKIAGLGVRVESLGVKRGGVSPQAFIRLVKIIRGWNPDIMQTWLYYADLLGCLAAKFTGMEYLVWNIRCSNIGLRQASKVTLWTIKACALLSNLPSAILTNSVMARDYHIRTFGYKPEKFQYIPNGFDLASYKSDIKAGQKIRKELDVGENAVCIGHVARYNPLKDHASFFKAVQIVKNSIPDVICIMAGLDIDRNNKQLVRMIEELDLWDNVRLLGKRNDIPDIMNAMDIYCSSSVGEGFPNVLGEAMACDVPCVVTDVGHSAAIVAGTGLVVPPGQYKVLAKAMAKLLSITPEKRNTLGQKARQRIETKYSLGKIVKQYEMLYSKVVG